MSISRLGWWDGARDDEGVAGPWTGISATVKRQPVPPSRLIRRALACLPSVDISTLTMSSSFKLLRPISSLTTNTLRLSNRQFLQPLQPIRAFSISRTARQDPKDIKITSNYKQPPVPKGNSNQLPVFPLVAIFVIGTFLFYRLTKSREGQGSNRSPFNLPKAENTPSQFDKKNLRES